MKLLRWVTGVLGKRGNDDASVDFSGLCVAVRDAAKRAFAEVRESHPDEEFYAFALYTDDGVMTIVPAANSEEGYQRAVSEYGGMDPVEMKYLRWATAEWAYEAAGHEHFQTAYDLLDVAGRYDSEAEARFAAFKNQVLAAMVEALRDLDSDGFFGSGDAREKITLFVSISDSDMAEQVEDDSARKLNPKSVYERFSAGYQ